MPLHAQSCTGSAFYERKLPRAAVLHCCLYSAGWAFFTQKEKNGATIKIVVGLKTVPRHGPISPKINVFVLF